MSKDQSRRKFFTFMFGFLVSVWSSSESKASNKTPSKKNTPKKIVTKKPAPGTGQKNSVTLKPSPSASGTTRSPAGNPSPSPNKANSPTDVKSTKNSIDARELIYDGRVLTLENFAVGSSVMAKYAIDRGYQPVIVTRVDSTQVTAFTPICTHLRGPVTIEKNHLYCNRHGAKFNRDSGDVITGPTSTPLAKEAIEIIDGVLYRIPGGSD